MHENNLRQLKIRAHIQMELENEFDEAGRKTRRYQFVRLDNAGRRVKALNANHVKRFIDQSAVLKFIAIEISHGNYRMNLKSDFRFSKRERTKSLLLRPAALVSTKNQFPNETKPKKMESKTKSN